MIPLMTSSSIASNVTMRRAPLPNPNYQAGVRFERERMKHYVSQGYAVMRTAGSHGFYDVIAFSPRSVMAIQCKVVATQTQATKLLKDFKASPPMSCVTSFIQVMEVKVKGSREVQRVMV